MTAAERVVFDRVSKRYAGTGSGHPGAVGAVLGVAGVPSSYLFGALLLGLAVAIVWPQRLEVPARAFAAAQAVTVTVVRAGGCT